MKTHDKKKAIKLSKETIRTLSDAGLGAVGGGQRTTDPPTTTTKICE